MHGNLDQSARVSTFNEFIKEGKSTDVVHTILFCTDVAARGLDFPNLAGSVQYDAPCDIHDYIHRAGRTGRLSASKAASIEVSKAKSIIFLMPSEEAYVQRLTSMGMKTLRKESFDEYLKWVEKLDAKKLQSLIASKKQQHGGKFSNAKKDEISSENGNEESAIIAALPSTLKARLGLLQKVIEAGIVANPELSDRARNGFLSSCRAYATHPAAEKDIFHIKRLHLGHLAAAFGLDREPKKMLNGNNNRKPQKSNYRDGDIPAEIAQGSSRIRKEMRDRQKELQGGPSNDQQFNNRLSFSSQKRPSNNYDSKQSSKNPSKQAKITKKPIEYEEDDDGDVVFAY